MTVECVCLDRLSLAPTQMTDPMTLMTPGAKFLCGHGLLNTAARGQGVCMSPGLIKPCHFSPRGVMQSLTSAAMVANVLQALTDDSDSVSTASPDSNFSVDSVECNLTPHSESNHSNVTASKTAGADAVVARAVVDSGFEKQPANETVDEKMLSGPLGEGGDFCPLKNPSGGGEGVVGVLIRDCEIDTELTSKEKTKQWLACPSACLWKDGRKVVDQEVRGHDVENRDDLEVRLTQDSLSGSPGMTPRSSDIDFQDEVEKLATLFTRLDAGSSEEDASSAMLSQKSSRVKGRMSRESLRLPKARAASSSSSFGRRSPAPKGLYRTTTKRLTGSLDRDSARLPGQRSAKSLDMRMSTGSMDRECSEATNLRSRSSLHPTSLGSSAKTSSSSVTDHLAPTVSEIERRLTDLIGHVEQAKRECLIPPGDIVTGDEAVGTAPACRDSDIDQEGDSLATSFYQPKHIPKLSLDTDTGKYSRRVLKHAGSDTVDETSGKSTSMEEDSLEKSGTDGSSPYWTTPADTDHVAEMTANDSSVKSGTADSLMMANMTETSADTAESPDSTSVETDSLNKTGVRGKPMKHSHIAVRQRGLSVKQRQMLFGTPAGSKRETVSMTSGQRMEYSSDETWTDDSVYHSSSADHVADSERESSDDLRSTHLSRHGSTRLLMGVQPEAVSGLMGLLDTNTPVKRESATSLKMTATEKVTVTDKQRLSRSETRFLSVSTEAGLGKLEEDSPEEVEARLQEDARETSPRRVRHPTGYHKLKEDECVTSTEKKRHRKTSGLEPSHLDDIDTDSLTEDAPFLSPSTTNPTLARREDHVTCGDLSAADFSHLMAQVSEKSLSSQGLFVSPVQSRVISRSDLNAQFLSSGDLDKELRSPKRSATQLSESMAEEYRSTVDSASVDDTEDGFVTPDEERSLSPDVEDWLFDPEKPILADINEVNLVELISLSSRSATPLADSLASELMSPSNQTLVDSGSRASTSTRVAGFVSPEQSKMYVSQESSPVNLESEPEFDVVPQPHSQTPNEDKGDNDLEVTSSDEGEHESANEQVPEKRVFDMPEEDRAVSPNADMQNDSVDQTTCDDKTNFLKDLPVLRKTSTRGFHNNEIFSQVALYSSDDDADDKVPSAEPVDQPQSCDQHVTQVSLDDVKQESKSPLPLLDVNNCSSGDSIAVKDTQSDQSCRDKLHIRSEVSSSEDDLAMRTDTVRTFGELQKEIADVIGPVLGTTPTMRGAQDSVMSDVLKLAFSRSLQTAVTGGVVTEGARQQPPMVDTKEDVSDTAQDVTQHGLEMMSRDTAGDETSDTSTDRAFGPHLSLMPVSQHWSHLMAEDIDPRGRLTTVIEQDETSRSSVTSSLSVKSSKSSDIDVSETDSDKNETKRMTMGAWDADISSQSETEMVLLRGSLDSGFVSSPMDQAGNVTILGQSEYSSQENLCKESVAFSKRWDNVGKFLLQSYDTPTTLLMAGTGNLPAISGSVGDCGRTCELAISPVLQLPDVNSLLSLSDLTATLGKRETNISRPSTSKTSWKLSRPPSLLAVVTEDDAEEKPDSSASQKRDGAKPSCDAAPSFKQSGITCSGDLPLGAEIHRATDSLLSSHGVPYLGADSSVNLSEMNVSTDDSIRHSTGASSELAESNGNEDERATSPVTTERKRSPSGIPLLRRAVKSNADCSQMNTAPSTSKVRPPKAGQMPAECKSAAGEKEVSLSQKVARIFGSHQKATSSDTLQRSSQRPNTRHPSSPVPQTSSYLRAKGSSTDSSCSDSAGKKPPLAKLTKSVVRSGRQADDSRVPVTPVRQRYASAGMVTTTPSTRTRIPSAVSLRALSYDRNVQARVDSRFASCCTPRQATSSSSAKDSMKQSRPGKMHSARSASKMNRRNKLSTSKSPSKRLSKSVDSLDRVERSPARVGRVASEVKATKLSSRKSSSKDVVKVVPPEVKGESKITVKLPNIDVVPVTSGVLNDTDSIDSVYSKAEERDSNVGDTDSADAQNKKPAKAAISIQTEFPPKKGHKKKQKRRTESVKKEKTKQVDEVAENDIQLTTSESDAVDIELTGLSLSKKNLASRKVSAKLAQKHSAGSLKSPFKITLRHCKQDFTSNQSPFEGPQTLLGGPEGMGRRVHYDVEMESSGYETSMTKPPAEHMHKPEKDEPEMATVDVKQEADQQEVTTEQRPTFDQSELIVLGKALKLLQSPASMKGKSMPVQSDDTYIAYASKLLNEKTESTENSVEPSTYKPADKPMRPLPEATTEPSKISSSGTVVDIANIERETRYSDGQIKRDNMRDHTPADTSSDGSLKTKIPSRKKFGGVSKSSLTEVSSTKSDEATMSKLRNVKREKFPPKLTKAISDMVISKTDSITEDIIRQLCKNMPDADQQPSDSSTEAVGKSERDMVPDASSAVTDHVEMARPVAEAVRKRTKVRKRSAHPYHGTPLSPASSVKSLVQTDHQHPASDSPRAMQSDKSASQPTSVFSSYQPLVTQSDIPVVCQPVVTQSSTSNQSAMSQLPVLQTGKSPVCHPALTRSNKLLTPSKSPTRNPQTTRSQTRHLSLSQTGRSPTRQPVLTKSGRSPTRHSSLTLCGRSPRQLSPVKSNRSPRLSQLDDAASRQSRSADKQDGVASSEKGFLRRIKKPDYGNNFASTVFPSWQEVSKLFEADNEEARNGSDSQRGVSQADIVAILQRFRRMHARVTARASRDGGQGADLSPSTSNHSDTPEGMSDDKVLDSTLVTAASVIIQTRDMVMQQLTNDGDTAMDSVNCANGTTPVNKNTTKKRDGDNKVSLHAMKKDAEQMLTCVTKTSNEILNYMSPDKIDVTSHLLKQLQQEEGKDSSTSQTSSDTSLFPTKAEPESWMSLNGWDPSEKHSLSVTDSDTGKTKKAHKKKHSKKPNKSSLPSPQVKPKNSLVKKLLNISHMSVHIGGEKSGSYISTLHKKNTLKKLMDMKNPRAQVKKLLQKSQENISLSRKDLEELKQGSSSWRSRKLTATSSSDRGWRANWDDVATIEPLPVLKKKRSCSGTSSIRSRISVLSVTTKRRSQSAVNSPSKSKLQLPTTANSDVTKLLQKTRAIMTREPLCVDLKQLIGEAVTVTDDSATSPSSAHTMSPMQRNDLATAQNNSPSNVAHAMSPMQRSGSPMQRSGSPSYGRSLNENETISARSTVLSPFRERSAVLTPTSPRSIVLTPFKERNAVLNPTSPRSMVLSPFKDTCFKELSLSSTSYSSVTSKGYYSAENETSKQASSTDAKQAACLEPRRFASFDVCPSQSAESNRNAATPRGTSPANMANVNAARTETEKSQTASSGGDFTDSQPMTHADECAASPTMPQVMTNMKDDKSGSSSKVRSRVYGRRHPSGRSKTSASVESISWAGKKPFSARSKDSFSTCSLNITPGRYSTSTESMENNVAGNVAAGRLSSDCSSVETVFSDGRRDKQVTFPGDLSVCVSPLAREDTTAKVTPQEEPKVVTSKTEPSPVDDVTVEQPETVTKENTSAFSLSALPQLAMNLGAAAIDRLSMSIRRSISPEAQTTTSAATSPGASVTSDGVKHAPETKVTEAADSKATTPESSAPKSSLVRSQSQRTRKTQSAAGSKGVKFPPSKDGKKSSLSDLKTHKEATQRSGKALTKKLSAGTQLQRSSTTVKKPPQKKRQGPHRKPAAKEAGPLGARKGTKKVLSLDSELNALKNMLNSEFGSSSESLETLTSSKISTTSVPSSTDDLSLSELTTDRSVSPTVGKTSRRMGRAMSHLKKSLTKGRHAAKDRGDRGEPQMRDTTTDPMFSWHYDMPPHATSYAIPQVDLHQYMSSYPYAASSEIVQSLTELEHFISELSSLVDSKGLYEPTEEPQSDKTKSSAPTSPAADMVDSFFDIATFASNLSTSFEEISSSAISSNSAQKAAWKENMRAKALLNNTHLGRIYLQQMAKSSARDVLDVGRTEAMASDNNEEFSDDQLATTDYLDSSSSLSTSTSSQASVIITPRPNAHSDAKHSMKKSQDDRRFTQLTSDEGKDSSDGSCPVKHEHDAAHDSTQDNVEDSMHSAASEIDATESLSFITDSGDELPEVTLVSSNPCVNTSSEQPQRNRKDSNSSSGETRGVKRKGTMALEKIPSKDFSPSIFFTPATLLSQMPQLQQMSRSSGMNLTDSGSDTKNRFILRASSDTGSSTRSGSDSTTTGAAKQLSEHDIFNLFFTYLGPEKAHAYLEKSASLSSSVKPLSPIDQVKNSAMESMCPSRGSSMLSNNTAPSGYVDVSHVSSYSKPSSHMSPMSLMTDNLLMRDAMRGDSVGLPSTALLKKVEMFYDQKMNGTGNDLDLSQFMQWLHSGNNSGSPAERALHSALRFYQSRPDGDVQPMELTPLTSGSTGRPVASDNNKQNLVDAKQLKSSSLH